MKPGKIQANEPPQVWCRSLTFSDGTELALGRSDIVVIVGPNNAGKSAALKEVHQRLVSGPRPRLTVLSDVKFDTSENTPDDVETWMISSSTQDKNGHYRLPMVGSFAPGAGSNVWSRWKQHGLQMLANRMTLHLNTEARLTAANPSDLINFVSEVVTQPLHRLYEDDDLEMKLDAIFFRAFREHLIVNRGAGKQVMLHTGARPAIPEGKDRQSKEYRSAVNELPPVHTQGDGMRAFVGVIASVLAADRDIVFIDEPEAFLHPPQATTLGRVLAEQSPKERQLIVSTHISDFLRGILDYSSPRVRVVRLQRDGDVNHVTELEPDVVRSVWADPLLRYSKVMDGLFHDGVIVCEGDADCRFYGAMIDAIHTEEPGPDLALVS